MWGIIKSRFALLSVAIASIVAFSSNSLSVIDGLQNIFGGEGLAIHGKWNQKKAWAAVLEEINIAVEKGAFVKLCDPECNHRLFDQYHLVYPDKESIVVAAISSDGSDCHACLPTLSFVEFVEKPDGWAIGASDIAVLQSGGWGFIAKDAVNAAPIGYNIYGIFISSGWTGQGWTGTHLQIYAKVANHFKSVFRMCTGVDSSGQDGDDARVSWDSTYRLIEKPMGFYDIEVKASGKNYKPIKSTTVFSFNGASYDAPKAPKYLKLPCP